MNLFSKKPMHRAEYRAVGLQSSLEMFSGFDLLILGIGLANYGLGLHAEFIKINVYVVRIFF